MNALELEAEALKLPPVERIRLADFLLASVETTDNQTRLDLWADECDDRYAAYLRGDIESVGGDEVMSRLRTLIRK